jgi:hypothetical protein
MPGKEHLATDELSRNPCFSASDWLEVEKLGVYNRCLRDDLLLTKMF